MVVRVVRLGTERAKDEGLRIGTVRRPPRGVPKEEFAAENWYDVWYPNLAPSAETMKLGQEAQTPAQWAAFIASTRPRWHSPTRAAARLAGGPVARTPTSRWAATARTRRTAIARCCARCCSKRAPGSDSARGR